MGIYGAMKFAQSLSSGNSKFTNDLVGVFFSWLTVYLEIYLSETSLRELSIAFCQ